MEILKFRNQRKKFHIQKANFLMEEPIIIQEKTMELTMSENLVFPNQENFFIYKNLTCLIEKQIMIQEKHAT